MATKLFSLILLSVMYSALLSNCNSIKQSSKGNVVTTGETTKFDKFYDKFHKNSSFSVSRTKFPLGGMTVDGFEKTKWTMENLPVMKTKIYDIDTSLYKVSFKKTKKTFIQKVWLEDSGFSTECRFELINNKWYLVYVLDQNL